MKIKKEVEFNNIVYDILNNDKFIDLKYEIHHGISRMEHCLNVARLTYMWCKKMHLKNYEEITRAALLHDFYTSKEVDGMAFLNHPYIACVNASEQFEITNLQKDIISSHMFPISKKLPKSKESLLVSVADKTVAIYECAKYKAPLQAGTILLFVISFLSIQR